MRRRWIYESVRIRVLDREYIDGGSACFIDGASAYWTKTIHVESGFEWRDFPFFWQMGFKKEIDQFVFYISNKNL